MSKAYRSILIISDQHYPYAHPDIYKFLSALKKKYRPDKVVNIGDEIDGHSLSFHEKNPDLMGPSDELQTAINRLRPIYKLFPSMDLIESNHGSLVYRRGIYAGLPTRVFKSYRDILEAPKDWRWHEDLVLKASDGSLIYFCHGRSKNSLRNSQQIGMNFVQGHHHSTFEICYWANSLNLHWGMTVGCLVDKKSLAFAYGKTLPSKPIIGCGAILDGIPKLLPMILNKNGRWTGYIP